jgi:lysophospholipase L1-like esterase
VNSKSVVAAIVLLALGFTTAAQSAAWVQTWGAAPLPSSAAMGPFPATPSFNHQTIRQTLRLSVGGSRIRVRLSNEYGSKPLSLGAVRVALADEHGNARPGSERQALFAGRPEARVPPGAPLLSDPIDLPVGALATLIISIFVPEDTGACTCHPTGMQSALVSDAGDYTDKAFKPASTTEMRAFVTGVETEVARDARTVVVLGDSITDGVGSTPGANRRWPDLLAIRLNGPRAAKAAGGWGVVNMGISGNRVLADGFGVNALARFDRDVLAVAGVKALIVLEGINDIGIANAHMAGQFAELFKSLAAGSSVSSESMIAGYRQIIARAHARGIKVMLATILPYGGADYYSEAGEFIRQAVNQWIRTGGAADAVVDFDAVIRDPAVPTRMKEGFHSGDHLHGSDAGYEAMAAAVDLAMFK